MNSTIQEMRQAIKEGKVSKVTIISQWPSIAAFEFWFENKDSSNTRDRAICRIIYKKAIEMSSSITKYK